jgi:ATP-binding cassette subfamily D (ALD) protein 3
MVAFSKVKRAVKIGASISVILLILKLIKKMRSQKKRPIKNDDENLKINKAMVNKRFFKDLLKLLSFTIFKNGVLKYFILFNIFLLFRTILSIYLQGIKGKIVKAIISSNQNQFLKNMGNFALISIPGALTNSLLEYISGLISLNIRKSLVEKMNNKYLKGRTFYHLSNVDDRIDNPDQIFTDDINQFSEAVTLVYSEFSKPLLDIVLFSKKLSESVSWRGPSTMIGWYLISGFLLKTITPSFGRLTAEGLKLEGIFRSGHQRLIQHSEEIAFLRGGKFELQKMKEKFANLLGLYRYTNKLKFLMGIFDSILVKYGAYNIGLSILSFPVFGPGKEKYLLRVANDPSKIMRDYEQNSGLLINLAKAVGKIVISYKDVQNLAGITSRVAKLNEVIDDLNIKKRYSRKIVDNKDIIFDQELQGNNLQKGKILQMKDAIKLQEIPIMTPGGEVLIKDLTLKITNKMNCVIIGPNGSGKTGFIRVLAGLWPFFKGKLFKCSDDEILYLPQTSYIPKATLREVMIYPDIVSSKSDFELKEMMELVGLKYLVERGDTFDKVNDWYEVLSGGEKQRISIIRMFYHNPKFAVLDEATSEISVDIENNIYMMAKKKGISLITVVTQKKSFYNYHDFVLTLDGHGEWSFEKIKED